ncbi:MAG TPA: response regulator [Aquabacterium sp.]|nr:response regulator [Aquabacterium sp.]
MATILVVDDELGIRALLSDILTDEGHTVELAENAAQARVMREQCKPDLVLLDIWMPDVDGVTLLKEWGANGQLTMPVIMMSGHGTIDTAVEATKVGAQAFLEKPITMQKLLRAVDQALVKPSPAAPAQMARPVTLSGSQHLASVTPITAAPSYNHGGQPQLVAIRGGDHLGSMSGLLWAVLHPALQRPPQQWPPPRRRHGWHGRRHDQRARDAHASPWPVARASVRAGPPPARSP